MADLQDLVTLLSSLSPEEKAAVQQAISPEPDRELTPREQELLDLQAEVATIAGSEQAGLHPASVHQQIIELHARIDAIQHELGHAQTAAELARSLSDRVQGLEARAAYEQRSTPEYGGS